MRRSSYPPLDWRTHLVVPLYVWSIIVTAVVAGMTARPARADSMTVPDVELREVGPARYELEAEVVPEMVAALRPPQLPSRCGVEGPTRSQDGDIIRWVVPIDCGGEALGPRDVIVLPWGVDGIQLTARWGGADPRRALFGRESAGVVVRLHLIMAPRDSFADVAVAFGAAGFRHFWGQWGHVLLMVALALFGRHAWVGLGGLIAGHALALVVVELFGVTLSREPAEAVVAMAAALLMAELVEGTRAPRGLLVMTALVGAFHGLGTADELMGEGAFATHTVASIFSTHAGVALASIAALGAASLVVELVGPVVQHRRTWAAVAIGTAAVVATLGALTESVSGPPDLGEGSAAFMEIDTDLPDATQGPPSVVPPPPEQLTASGRLASPFISYIIIEPYQVRHEVLIDLKALREWMPIPDVSGAIPIESQAAMAEEAVKLVAARCPVVIDGVSGTVAAESAELVTIGADGVTSRPNPIPEPLETAVLAATVTYETTGLADTVVLEWGLFSDSVRSIPLTVTDPAAAVEAQLDATDTRFEWRNTLGDFTLPEVEALKASSPRWPLPSMALAVVAIGFLLATRARAPVVVSLALAYVLYPFVRVEAPLPFAGARVDRAEAAELVEGLLVNIYRSFDIHNEELIYDRLALTVTGDQLLDIYLESRRALELENRGGARVRIEDVTVRGVRDVRPDGRGGFELDAEWTVGGAVNHFGHIHFRQNRYEATITMAPVDGNWKISRLELLEEQRVL